MARAVAATVTKRTVAVASLHLTPLTSTCMTKSVNLYLLTLSRGNPLQIEDEASISILEGVDITIAILLRRR